MSRDVRVPDTPTPRMRRLMLGSLLLCLLAHTSAGALVMEVQPYPAPIYVNAPAEVPVLNVIGKDNVTGRPIRHYELSRGVNSTYFRIDRYGRILTAKTINKRVGTVLTFFVFGFMDGSIESKHVMITVTEKNEYPPHFLQNTYEFDVYRYAVGEVIGRVLAVDNDTEDYNRVFHYELPISGELFTIHDNGSLLLARPIPPNHRGRLQLPIMAVDAGSPSLLATANLDLKIKEIRQPHSFCFTTAPGSTRVCWKNPMPGRAVPGYNVIVVSPIRRQEFVPAQPDEEELCHVVNGTQIGNVYQFRVEIPTTSSTPGMGAGDLYLNVTNYGFSPQCMTENFDSCHYLQPCGNGGTCGKDRQDMTSSYTCACAAGWRGRNCTEQDLCYNSPCKNSAPCRFLGHRQYRCECTELTFGQNCQHFNVCSSSPCRNGGSCRMRSDGTFQCLCPPNFSGSLCQTPDPCSPSPCFRGTCQSVSAVEYRCDCVRGFYGFNCDEYNICILEEPCLNNGTCHHLGNNSYGCSCLPQWTGPICELFNPCSLGVCRNNGTCTATMTGSYDCHCNPGFYGNECQDFDPCHNDPCQGHGACRSTGGASVACECEEGYYGDRCEFFNPCVHSPCQHGGACRNISNDVYVCDCLPEWEGVNCQHLNGCRVITCENGARCESRYPFSYTCNCTPGFYGERCTFFNPCVSDPCQHGGVCTNTSSGNYRCQCPGGYSGVNCELYDPCFSDPCKNGGSCRRVSDSEIACDCASGYVGKTCEKRHPCSLSPCYNGGTCSMTSMTTRKCACAEPYFGNDCENYDHCASKPCQHGACFLGNASMPTTPASADETALSFMCQCDPGYTGMRCEVEAGGCQERGCQNGGTCQANICTCTEGHTGVLCETRVSQMPPHCKASESRDATGRYEWPLMYVGMTTYQECANAESEGNQASRRCGQDDAGRPAWEEPNTATCLATGLADAERKLQELKSLTEDASQLSPHEVSNFTGILEEVQPYSLLSKSIADDMVTVVSNLNAVNVSVMLLSDASNQTSVRLVRLLESYTRDIGNSSVVITTANINVNARDVSVRTSGTVDYSPVLLQGNDTEETAIRLTLPPLGGVAELGGAGRVRVQFLAYRQALLFLPRHLQAQDQDQDPNSPQQHAVRAQAVVTAIVKGRQLRNLTQPVVIQLPNIERGGNHSCYYWDIDKREWASAGVVTSSQTGNTTQCLSYHLTSFAILLDPSPDYRLSAVHEEVLTYISYIGSAVSMLGLLLTILTYALFRCLHGEKSGKILLNLCVSLLLLNVAFLLGSQHSSTYGAWLCVAVAVLLHYFLLASLLWMLVEALEMYQALITVFSKYARFYLTKRCLVAWGIPIVIVVITLAVDLSHYKASKDFCFISQASAVAYYVALVAPACVILVINTVVFILVARVILQPRFQQQQRQGSDSSLVTPAQIRGAFTVMILLGVTWVFGPLAVNEAKVVFNYLFCILNSLQGFLIFIFRCLFNPEARLAWLYLIKTGKLKRKRGPIKSMDTDSTSKADSKSRTNGHYTGTLKTNIMQSNGWHHPKLNGCPKDGDFCNGKATRYFDMNVSDGSDKVFTTQENFCLSKKPPFDSSSGDVEEEFTHL